VPEDAMTTVANVLRTKAEQHLHTVAPDVSVFDAAKRMAEHNIGSLVVIEGGQVIGLFTERDCARKVVPMTRAPRDVQVCEVMTAPVMYVGPHRTSEQCMALMTEHRVRHLPVVDDNQLIGIISIGDLVKDIISEQQFTIEQLEHYISGARA
jgi:CBS domain-containing protein